MRFLTGEFATPDGKNHVFRLAMLFLRADFTKFSLL